MFPTEKDVLILSQIHDLEKVLQISRSAEGPSLFQHVVFFLPTYITKPYNQNNYTDYWVPCYPINVY
jgi:hypothetical protein